MPTLPPPPSHPLYNTPFPTSVNDTCTGKCIRGGGGSKEALLEAVVLQLLALLLEPLGHLRLPLQHLLRRQQPLHLGGVGGAGLLQGLDPGGGLGQLLDLHVLLGVGLLQLLGLRTGRPGSDQAFSWAVLVGVVGGWGGVGGIFLGVNALKNISQRLEYRVLLGVGLLKPP